MDVIIMDAIIIRFVVCLHFDTELSLQQRKHQYRYSLDALITNHEK